MVAPTARGNGSALHGRDGTRAARRPGEPSRSCRDGELTRPRRDAILADQPVCCAVIKAPANTGRPTDATAAGPQAARLVQVLPPAPAPPPRPPPPRDALRTSPCWR